MYGRYADAYLCVFMQFPSSVYSAICMPFSFSSSPTRFRHGKKMRKPIALLPILTINVFFIGSSSKLSPAAPALYVFGDSLFDSGNNNFLPTLAKANFAPYGMNFEGGPTGRFTNGRTAPDFIAEFLQLPYSPPYMSLEGTILLSDQVRGMNFASGGCGILPETGKNMGHCLSLAEQTNFFADMVKHELPKHYKDSDELSDYLSKSVFLFSTGSNDYINNYLLENLFNTSKKYTPQAFAKRLIHHFSHQIQKLYQLGARKVIVFEIGPIGCIPSVTRLLNHTGQCVEEINHLATLFNNQLIRMIQNLKFSLPGSTFILGHTFWLAYDAIIKPSKYGFIDSTNPCCATWLNGTLTCIPEVTPVVCKDPNKHLFWDGYHLTEGVYRTIVSHCLNGSSVCIPMNVQDLVSQV